MKFRLSGLIELVFALGCGLGLVRAVYTTFSIPSLIPRYVVEPFLVGTALIGMLSLCRETWANPIRQPWDIGRWTFAIAGWLVLIDLSVNVALLYVRGWKRGQAITERQLIGLLSVFTTQFYGRIAWFLLVFWIARPFSGMPRGREPDGRELAGRLLLISSVLWSFAYYVYEAAVMK